MQLAAVQQVSYLTQDHLGSTRVVTNENGAVRDRKDYSAFGEETTTAQRTQGLGFNPPDIRQDYTGYEKDEESGLEFAQARYYNPTHGRFTSVDPLTASATIRNPQSFNRYTYVLNSPYKFADPLGLISSTTGACGQHCPNGEDSLVGGGGGAFDSIVSMIGIDIYYVYTQTSTYTASSSYKNNHADITVTVTKTWIEDRGGNRIAEGEPNVAAVLSNVTGYGVVEQAQIKTIAEAAARAALNIGIDVGDFLGVIQGETEFGMHPNSPPGTKKYSVSNPSQYSSGRAQTALWSSPEYDSVLQYNLEQSIINVYQPFWKSSGGNLWDTLYNWNGNTSIEKNGLQQRENFANRVSTIIRGIRGNAAVGLPTRAGYFWSFGTPSWIPQGGYTRCTIFTPYCNQ